MKENMSQILVLGLVLVAIVAISGCTNNSQAYGKEIYKGDWKVAASHFAIKQELIDAFIGNYVAYQNGTTITLIGTGKQMSVENNTQRQIKIVFTQSGQDVNVTYYLDNKLGGYDYINQTNTTQMFELNKKTWEGSLTTAEQQLLSEINSRTESVKL